MSRDIAVVSIVLAFVLFVLGVLVGTSQFAGMLVIWTLAAVALIVAIVAGIRASLCAHYEKR